MKRLLCMAFALGGMLSVALSQGTITCGTGDDASNLYPFNTNTASSWHEMIFDKTEVSDAAGCKITKVAFQRSSSSTQQTITAAPLQIYMGERTTSTHANVSDWTALADLTLVYNSTSQVVGNVAANAWQTFTLMGDGFAYSGEGHLVVVVVKTISS